MTVNVSKPQINLREKLSELDKPSGIAGQDILKAETPQEVFNYINAGRRNLIINGDFQVSQRGDFTTASSAVNQQYFVDRWFTDVGTVAYTKQHTTGIDIDGLPAISKGVKLTATASGTSYMGIRQKIENPTQYIGRTFTYSAWVRSNNPKARLSSYIGGSVVQTVLGNTHSGNGQWEKLSMTFTITGNPTTAWFVDAFIVSDIFSNTAISSGDYIEVTNLQLEVGKVATPFEHRSYGEELALCQRYYSVIISGQYKDAFIATNRFASSATVVSMPFKYPVAMRANPTIAIPSIGNLRVNGRYGDTALTGGTVSVADINTRGALLTVSSPTASGWTFNLGESLYINSQTTTSNILTADAEL